MTHSTIPEDLLECVARSLFEANEGYRLKADVPLKEQWPSVQEHYRLLATAALNAAGDWLRESVTRPEPLTRSTLNASLKGPEEWKP